MQDEVDGFVDLAQREEEDEDAGAEAGEGAGAGAGEGAGEGAGTRTTRPTTHHEPGQEPEQDEFQDLESVGQQDDLYDFDDHKYIEESDHFGTPSADKVRGLLLRLRVHQLTTMVSSESSLTSHCTMTNRTARGDKQTRTRCSVRSLPRHHTLQHAGG